MMGLSDWPGNGNNFIWIPVVSTIVALAAGFRGCRGHLLLALVTGLRECCPLEQIAAQPTAPANLTPFSAAAAAIAVLGSEGGGKVDSLFPPAT